MEIKSQGPLWNELKSMESSPDGKYLMVDLIKKAIFLLGASSKFP